MRPAATAVSACDDSFDRRTHVFLRCDKSRHAGIGDPPQRGDEQEWNLKNPKCDAPYSKSRDTGEDGNSGVGP